MANYPGGKNGAGVWQRIINQMPPHDVYIELFAGSAAVLRNKLPAAESIAVDADAGVIAELAGEVLPPGTTLIHDDAVRWLGDSYFGNRRRADRRRLIYADPPYLPETRTKKRIYRYEMTRGDHDRLLRILTTVDAMVMISGYDSELYRKLLPSPKWRRLQYRTMTRGGTRLECLWMNFPEPAELHDYRWLGTGFRERERIRRQQRRWAARLAKMDRLQRLALMATLAGVDAARGTS